MTDGPPSVLCPRLTGSFAPASHSRLRLECSAHPNTLCAVPLAIDMSSFLRALSPAVGSILAASKDVTDDAARNARHSALLAANSLEELIAMVPQDSSRLPSPTSH